MRKQMFPSCLDIRRGTGVPQLGCFKKYMVTKRKKKKG